VTRRFIGLWASKGVKYSKAYVFWLIVSYLLLPALVNPILSSILRLATFATKLNKNKF
jgi:hypothetical protein